MMLVDTLLYGVDNSAEYFVTPFSHSEIKTYQIINYGQDCVLKNLLTMVVIDLYWEAL